MEGSMSHSKDITVSGPSGAGKSTLINWILNGFEECRLVVSHTTRAPRDGERDGVDYHFVDNEKFHRLIEAGDFLEYAEFDGHLYGTSKTSVINIKKNRKICIFDVVAEAALVLKKKLEEEYGSQCVLIFIRPPSIAELIERLTARGNQNMEWRIDSAQREMDLASRFDHVILNDVLDEAKRVMESVVSAEVQKISGANSA